MKTLQWGKIPARKVVGKENIWTLVGDVSHNGYKVDYSKMEELFCQNMPQPPSAPGTPRAKDAADGPDRKKKDEVRHTSDEKNFGNESYFIFSYGNFNYRGGIPKRYPK
jgi:hypothetical protein